MAKIDKYFSLSERQKFDAQSEIFGFCMGLMAEMNDQLHKREVPFTPYEVALMMLERYEMDDEFELAQATKDMIDTYDLKQQMDLR